MRPYPVNWFLRLKGSSTAERAALEGNNSLPECHEYIGCQDCYDDEQGQFHVTIEEEDATMLVYFAAPLFSVGERQYNEHLTHQIEALGYQIFLPQRDGAERSAPPYDSMTGEEWSRAVFHLDVEQLLAAEVVVMLLDGRVPDEGACVELGIAYAQKVLQPSRKLLIGLHTDRRGAFPGTKLNAMIQGALDEVAPDEDTLLKGLQRYQESGKLPGGDS